MARTRAYIELPVDPEARFGLPDEGSVRLSCAVSSLVNSPFALVCPGIDRFSGRKSARAKLADDDSRVVSCSGVL